MSGPLNSKEIALIESLESHQSQRGLARAAGFSLGMTNLLLKRLVTKGYVKVTTLNGRTLRYMLTPSGFAAKVRRSYQYMTLSIRFLNEMKARIREAALAHDNSIGPVIVVGQSELADLAHEVLSESGVAFERLSSGDWELMAEGLAPGSLCLVCDPELVLGPPMVRDHVKLVQLPGLMSNIGVQPPYE